jgi:hypothetical protein
MVNRKYGHGYPVQQSQEPEKYLPSFFLDVPFDNQIVKAEIRPLRKDIGYFTVNLNNVFLAHIHKIGDRWYDFIAQTNDLYMAVGKEIEAHLKKTD